MNKAFKMDLLLLKKRFSIYGFFNILSLSIVLTSIFIGIKVAVLMVGHPYITNIFLSSALILSTLPDVSYQTASVSHRKMATYFKNIPAMDIQNYYLYRKFFFFLFVLFYLFFPLSKEGLSIFFVILLVFGFYMLISSFTEKIFTSSHTKIIKYLLKYGYTLLCLAFLKGILPDISEKIITLPIYPLALVALILYLLVYFDLKRSYQRSAVKAYSTARFSYFKDFDILYIFRTDLIFTLMIIALLSLLTFQNQRSAFSFSILTSLLLIYFDLLKNETNKLHYFYKPYYLKKIRLNKLASISKFSIIYLISMIFLGIYYQHIFAYASEYLIAYLSFALTVFSVKINVEKRKQGPIFTTKDMLSVLLLSTCCVIFGQWIFTII